ncbi:hypothetical protein NE237_029241 [Protea cynaroides]|uniref:C3H1-type domain-containing protein n=1 Tax=Protea cynaroides TaxID=273540 RepID=A0A9Q0GRU1_9MAGN|nr:hypothetical protein NE237_029241 [Protea cynaroides]
MDRFYKKNPPKVSGNSIVSSINPKKDNQLLLNIPRYGFTSFTSTLLDSQTPDPLEMESALMHYPLAAAAATAVVPSTVDAFLSPVVDSSNFHPRLMQKYHHSSNFSSRSTSPSPLPLSIIDNLDTPPSRSPPVFTTPVKVEEDVLVMDGILVGSVSGGRSRSSSDSASLSPGNSLYKTEICRAWEETGSCRYNTKCQFAHGKEELRPGRYINKNTKFDVQVAKTWNRGTHGPKSGFSRNPMASASASAPALVSSLSASASASPAPPQPPELGMKKSTMKLKQEDISTAVDWSPEDDSNKIPIPSSSASQLPPPQEGMKKSTMKFKQEDSSTAVNWSPEDDGIEIRIPSSSIEEPAARETVDSYINAVLYGPSRRRRLPVFEEVCREGKEEKEEN